MPRLLLSVLAVLLVSGCSKLLIAKLDYDYYEDGCPLSVPDTVSLGRAFIASVTTSGTGCTSRGRIDVTIQDNLATITPYQYEDMSILGCDGDLELYTAFNDVTLQFRALGEAEVILRGRYNGEIVRVSRSVWVR